MNQEMVSFKVDLTLSSRLEEELQKDEFSISKFIDKNLETELQVELFDTLPLMKAWNVNELRLGARDII